VTRLRPLLVAAPLAIATMSVVATTPAHAVVTAADCPTRVANKVFGNGKTVDLPHDKPAVIAVTTVEERPRYRVDIELAGVRSTVGTGRGSDFGWTRSLNVPKSSKLGVGLYQLRVTTTVQGKPCTASGFIDVTGRPPVTTAGGAVAALAALLGLVAVALGLLRAGGRPFATRQVFAPDASLDSFERVRTPGDYVGWSEVACDVGARTFVTTTPSSETVRAFLAESRTREHLSALRARGARVRVNDDHALPRIKWRPRVYVVVPLLGALGGLGVVASLQQAGVRYPTATTLGEGALAGLVLGLVLANLGRRIGVRRINKRLAAAEDGLDHEIAEPLYPPLDHGDQLDRLDTFVWTPTHTVPEKGLPAWDAPNRATPLAAALDPGLPVRVVERRDGLAQIVCSNGWVGWTEGEQLEEIEA
jgi:hypothetical protein